MKRILLLAFNLLLALTVTAQDLDIFRLSSSASTYAVGYNPSLMADSRHRWSFNLGALTASTEPNGVHNTYLPGSSINLPVNGADYRLQNINIQGPSFMLQLPKGNAFAISTHYRAGQSATSNALFEGVGEESLSAGELSSYQSLGIKELAFSYAHSLSFNAHFVKLGASVKLGSAYYFNDFSGNVGANLDRISTVFDGTINGSSSDIRAGFNWLDMLRSPQGGVGVDLGFVYEFRPKYLEYEYSMDGKKRYQAGANKYLARFGFSITDIGNITSNANFNQSRSFNNTTIANRLLEEDFVSDLNALGIQRSENTSSQRTFALPRRINMFAEARLGQKGWHLGMAYRGETQEAFNGFGSRSIIAVYPRLEQDGAEFSIPFTYRTQSKTYGIGFHLRLGALFVGTESLNSLFQDNATSPTVYAGFSILGLAKNIKDRDRDAVSDRKDECIETAGIWAFKGCPDSDGDGIKDEEDKCPENAGPAETQGCPDADGDGIFDNQDACPDVAGINRFNGCPDTDGDGLPDSEDDCPQKAGEEEFGGCPDSDGDGLIDSEDNCPEIPGPKLFKGCPDTDGDGIPDVNDNCPNEKGTLENGGCADTDGDGILDKDDACPQEAGLSALQGCPDADGDGIKDSEDKCPQVAGLESLNGCPDTDGDGITDGEDSCPSVSGVSELDGCKLEVNFDLSQVVDSLYAASLSSLSQEMTSLSFSNDLLEDLRTLSQTADFIPTVVLAGNKASLLKGRFMEQLNYAGIQVEVVDENSENNLATIKTEPK